jgi:hypothetical protein
MSGAVLMVGVMEQYFIQASPIKYLAAFGAFREVLSFFGRSGSIPQAAWRASVIWCCERFEPVIASALG